MELEEEQAQEKGLGCDIPLRNALGTGSGLECLAFNCEVLGMKGPVNMSEPTVTSRVTVHMAQELSPASLLLPCSAQN